KYTSTGSTIGNSQIFDNGLFVGIGTSTPLTKLSVYGSTTIQTWENVPTAFRILNAATSSVFTVDTVNASTTIAGVLNVGNGTSTFNGGISTLGNLNVAGANATSTFANGITLANGCFAIGATCVAGVSTVSGAGTLNFVTKYTSTGSTIGNSQIFDNGLFVGIGTSTPLTTASRMLAIYGSTTIQTWQNVPTAFQILNAATSSVFTVDTVNGSTSIAGLLNVAGAGTSTINQNLWVQGTLQAGSGSLWLSSDWLTSNSTFTIANKNSTSNDIILNPGHHVGIGTSTPFGVLSVHATSSVPSFVIGSSTATSFIVDANGRVGIGLANPASILHVESQTGESVFTLGREGGDSEFLIPRKIF
ncbi:MAG: hypothetical protein Q7J73_08080, partial [Dehalococcoidales bacterium]|nr:hypothetical protein [Dehalococcoidales bacterium]